MIMRRRLLNESPFTSLVSYPRSALPVWLDLREGLYGEALLLIMPGSVAASVFPGLACIAAALRFPRSPLHVMGEPQEAGRQTDRHTDRQTDRQCGCALGAGWPAADGHPDT